VIGIQVTANGVTVTDSGDGIPADRLEELRRDIPRGLRRARSGLGLALAGWVADVHGGHLELDNRPEGGLAARLVLPVELGAGPAAPGDGPGREPGGRR
jgi:signal transduction histidine kinase